MARSLFQQLPKAGVRSIGITLRPRDATLPPLDIPDGAEWCPLDLTPGNRLEQIKGIFRLRALLKSKGVDVLHVHGKAALTGAALATAGMRRPVRVFTWHDSQEVIEEATPNDGKRRKALRKYQHVYGSSASVCDRLMKNASVHATVFPNGVAERPATNGHSGDVPTVLWMARLTPPKDPAAVLRAAAVLRDRGLRFRVILAGDAPARSQDYGDVVRKQHAELNLGDVVSMPGWIDDPGDVLAQSSIALQTSHTEGLSMSLLEQAISGLALVATDVGDTSSVVRPDETGLLIPPRDDEALVGALARLIEDAPLRERMGAAARTHALAHYSHHAMAEFAARQYGRAIRAEAAV